MKDLLFLAEKSVTTHLVHYYDVPRTLAERYAKVLIARWVGWALDKHIDGSIIGEDLYQEEDDWETPDSMPEGVKSLVKTKLPFPNLDHSESELRTMLAEEVRRAKEI